MSQNNEEYLQKDERENIINEEKGENGVNSPSNNKRQRRDPEVNNIMEDNENERANEPKKMMFKRVIGIGLALLSALIFAMMTLLIKVLYSFGYSGYEQLFYRGFIHSSIGASLVFKSSASLFTLTKQELKFLKYRSFVVISVSCCITICIGFMAASTIVVLFNTSPIFTPIIAKIFLNEKYSLVNIAAIICCVIGLVFIVQPEIIFGSSKSSAEDTSSYTFYIAICVILIVAALVAGLFVYTRLIKSRINPYIANFVTGPTMIIVTAFMAFVVEGRKPFYEWRGLLVIACIGCLMFIGNHTIYVAGKYEKATVLSIVMYSQVLMIYIGEIICFGLELGVYDIIGGIIIMISTLAISLHKLLIHDPR